MSHTIHKLMGWFLMKKNSSPGDFYAKRTNGPRKAHVFQANKVDPIVQYEQGPSLQTNMSMGW